MTPIFTITLDFDKDGRVQIWSQSKDKIPPGELKKLLAIKTRIERAAREPQLSIKV